MENIYFINFCICDLSSFTAFNIATSSEIRTVRDVNVEAEILWQCVTGRKAESMFFIGFLIWFQPVMSFMLKYQSSWYIVSSCQTIGIPNCMGLTLSPQAKSFSTMLADHVICSVFILISQLYSKVWLVSSFGWWNLVH